MFLIKYLPQKLRNKVKFILFDSKCKAKQIYRKFIPFKISGKTNLALAILCVKNVNYCDLTVNNANSLHYLNPGYNYIIYCDQLCADYLNNIISDFNYPKSIEIRKVFGDGSLPWQKYKIETLISASINGYILTDADGIWHQEPEIIPDKINILTLAYKIEDNKNEKILVEKLFNKSDWLKFGHYVTGFVYIPNRLMTVDLQLRLRNFVSKILDSDLGFLELEEIHLIKRISEELAVNFAIQSTYSSDLIVVLKEIDGPSSNNKLQSLYYGCSNKINL